MGAEFGEFSVCEVLLRMQELLRKEYGKDDLVLSDHFDFFAGTSTGAIIATALCWGMPVEEILKLYVEYGETMFRPVPWYRPIKKYFVAKFQAEPLSDLLQKIFSEARRRENAEHVRYFPIEEAAAGRGSQPHYRLAVAAYQ